MKATRQVKVPAQRDYVVAFSIVLVTMTLLALAQRNQGVTRDEAVYFEASESYFRWFRDLSSNIVSLRPNDSIQQRAIEQRWRINSEHPALLKTLFGASNWLLHAGPLAPIDSSGTPYISRIASFRVPTWFLHGLAAALLYLFGLRLSGRIAGFTAVLLFLTIPRLFFHSQVACFDSPITAWWLVVVYTYFRSLERWRWGIVCGITFGLALATKHNAWFIPPLLAVHYFWVVKSDCSLRPFRPPRLPIAFLSMGMLGPLVFILHWPWLWFDTLAHVKGYMSFHLHHSYYNIEFLGKNWGLPPLPISYPFVMALFTVPASLIALAIVGLLSFVPHDVKNRVRAWGGKRRTPYHDPWRFPAHRTWLNPALGLNPRVGLLLSLNAVFPLLLIAHPQTPIFGGTKHFLPAYPFWALLGGIGLAWIFRIARIRNNLLKRTLTLLFPFLVAMPGALSIFYSHPFGLSQYSAIVGGPAGAADLGLNRQYWGYATRQLLPWMNKTLPDHASIYWHDTNRQSYISYQKDHLLRRDLRYAGMERPAIRRSDYALVIYELHFYKYDYWIWHEFDTVAPRRVLTLAGVPLVSFYARPEGQLIHNR